MCSSPSSADLHLVLRQELDARHWTRRYFAQLLETRESTVGRWLSTNPATRKTPLPSTVLQMAEILEMDAIELLRAAGHLPMAEPSRPQHPRRLEIRARKRRFARIMESVDLSRFGEAMDWADILLDGLQAMSARLEPAPVRDDE